MPRHRHPMPRNAAHVAGQVAGRRRPPHETEKLGIVRGPPAIRPDVTAARASMRRPAPGVRDARRALVAWLTLVALAFPSLGSLPWAAAGLAAHRHTANAHAHDGAAHAGDHFDATSIPGSPLHPEDHDCAECKVLKHLSRCVPSAPATTFPPSIAPCDAPSRIAIALPPALIATFLPPVRAPPASA